MFSISLPIPGHAFELGWTRPGEERPHERLASPLVVKAMPLADGSFAPVALWLFRAYPKGASVVLLRGGEGRKRALPDDRRRPFDRLVAPGDRALYAPLLKSTMRDAFFGWLVDPRGPRRVKKV